MSEGRIPSIYKLLIVDDEAFIVDGLVYMFEKATDLNLDIYHTYSSVEALNWLKRTKFDIVLTDIRMPGITGLELQKHINNMWPRCKVIFLTGYDEFHYIQQVFRNSAVDYILKTEDEEVIINTVAKAITELDSQFESEMLISNAQKQLQATLPLLQKDFMWSVLQGEVVDEKRTEMQLKELEIPLSTNSPILFMLGRVDDWGDMVSTADRSLILYAWKNIVQEYLDSAVHFMTITYDKSKLVWILQTKNQDADWSHTVRFISETMDSVQYACKKYLRVNVSLLASENPVSWSIGAETFNKIERKFSFHYGLSRELILMEPVTAVTASSETEHNLDSSLLFKLSKLNLLETYLETGQKEKFQVMFFNIAEQFRVQPEEKSSLKMQFYFSVLSIYLSLINHSEVLMEWSGQLELSNMMRINEQLDWDEAVGKLWNIAEWIFDSQTTETVERERMLIRNIKQYVEQNLADDLSLTKIGEVVGYNPAYLSRLYKQITGEGLSDYIVEVRIEKAKELLKQPHVKIREVSEILGFETATYFTRFFKRIIGVLPSEYRESLMGK